MTMLSPEIFIKEFQNKSYETLIKERDKLIKEINHFKKHKNKIMKKQKLCPIYPSPDTIYLWNLKVLSKLDELIEDKKPKTQKKSNI